MSAGKDSVQRNECRMSVFVAKLFLNSDVGATSVDLSCLKLCLSPIEIDKQKNSTRSISLNRKSEKVKRVNTKMDEAHPNGLKIQEVFGYSD